MAGPQRAVFVDRDGTLIEDRDYLSEPSGVRLLPGVAGAIRRLNRAGVPVIVVTNQSGIGRGYYSEADYRAVHARMVELLEAEGARIDGVYHCPHAPDVSPACDCRKPLPGLFERAAREHDLDLGSSFYVGDRLRDVLPGTRKGGSGFVIRDGPDESGESFPAEITVVESLSDAIERVVAALSEN